MTDARWGADGLGVDEPADDPVHLHYAARRLIEELAARDPLALVFEDVYWADDPLLDLIDYLIATWRVGGCCSSRSPVPSSSIDGAPGGRTGRRGRPYRWSR